MYQYAPCWALDVRKLVPLYTTLERSCRRKQEGFMEYAIGIILGVVIAAAATLIGFDRDRSFYPTVLTVIAAYYVLFAAMGASHEVLVAEVIVAGGFFIASIIGFKKNLWVVAVGLIAHGVFDYGHHLFVENPEVPEWWPGFCLGIDVALGVWLAGLLMRRSNQ